MYGHRDIKNTACPGDMLYSEIQKWPTYGDEIGKTEETSDENGNADDSSDETGQTEGSGKSCCFVLKIRCMCTVHFKGKHPYNFLEM